MLNLPIKRKWLTLTWLKIVPNFIEFRRNSIDIETEILKTIIDLMADMTEKIEENF
jgi:hypothetical protein